MRKHCSEFVERLDDYAAARDLPAGAKLASAAHLRFGTISVRQLAAHADARAPRRRGLLSELIRRDFTTPSSAPRVVTQCFAGLDARAGITHPTR